MNKPTEPFDADRAMAALDALRPNHRVETESMLVAAYPAVRRAIRRGIGRKQVLDSLRGSGLKIGLAKLNDLINRHESGKAFTKRPLRKKSSKGADLDLKVMHSLEGDDQ